MGGRRRSSKPPGTIEWKLGVEGPNFEVSAELVERKRPEMEGKQAFAVLLHIRTVGVMGDFRTYAGC